MSRSLALVLGALMFSSALVAGYDVRGTDSRKPGKAHARSSDAELEGNVLSALHARFGAAATDIGVAAQDGFVFLYGEVRSEKLRVRAERIVARVAGVRAVSNELVPAPSGRTKSGPILAASCGESHVRPCPRPARRAP